MLFTWFQIIQLGCRFAYAGYCGIRQLSWKIFRFNIATRFCRFLFYSLHFLWITNNFQSIDFQIWYTVLPVSFSSNFLTTLFVSAICTLVSGDGNDTLNSSRINAIISVYISNEWIECSYLLTWSPIQRLCFSFQLSEPECSQQIVLKFLYVQQQWIAIIWTFLYDRTEITIQFLL